MKNSKILNIVGRAIPLRGDDIDTDRIIPARYLRCVTFDGLGEYLLEDDRKQKPDHPFNQQQFEGASILVVGKNFGCGSSREHAPQSLNKWGIKGLIGESFAEIFFANCQAIGLPCFTVDKEAAESLLETVEKLPSTEFTMDVKTATIRWDDRRIEAHLPPGTQMSLLEGTWNATEVLLQAEENIESTAARLPYLNQFTSAPTISG